MSDPWEAYSRWRSQFASILDQRFYALEWLDGEVWSGRMKIAANDDGAILFRLKQYPTGAIVVEGMAACGDLEAIKALIPIAEDWGRSLGAIAAEIASTEGWKRALRTDGYSPHQLVVRKEL